MKCIQCMQQSTAFHKDPPKMHWALPSSFATSRKNACLSIYVTKWTFSPIFARKMLRPCRKSYSYLVKLTRNKDSELRQIGRTEAQQFLRWQLTWSQRSIRLLGAHSEDGTSFFCQHAVPAGGGWILSFLFLNLAMNLLLRQAKWPKIFKPFLWCKYNNPAPPFKSSSNSALATKWWVSHSAMFIDTSQHLLHIKPQPSPLNRWQVLLTEAEEDQGSFPPEFRVFRLDQPILWRQVALPSPCNLL